MNNFINDNDNDNGIIFIPPHLSKLCLITIHFMLLSAIVYYFLGYEMMALLLLILYVIGFIYWQKPYYNTIFKQIDFFVIMVMFCFASQYVANFKDKYKKICVIAFLFLLVIGIINETLYRFKIVGLFGNDKIEPFSNDFSYFTLDYTYPNTIEREKCCQFSVLVHCLFLHIMPNIVGLYCLIGNTYF